MSETGNINRACASWTRSEDTRREETLRWYLAQVIEVDRSLDFSPSLSRDRTNEVLVEQDRTDKCKSCREKLSPIIEYMLSANPKRGHT